tara:strand:- start:1325 stop:2023 length:699 start_codon:yes stop_codon:yes gene_type:complete
MDYCKQEDYLKKAQNWAYDEFYSSKLQARRYLIGILMQFIVIFILLIIFTVLFSKQTLVPIPIRINETLNTVKIDSPNSIDFELNEAMIQSDLIRYVKSKETYSYEDLNYRLRHLQITTESDLFNNLRKDNTQSSLNNIINSLGKKGVRSVDIQDVIFLEKEDLNNKSRSTHNLAKLDFSTTTMLDSKIDTDYWVATISWQYLGTPDNLDLAWDNWNGFMVTMYRVDKRIIK